MSWANANLNLTKETYDKAKEIQSNFLNFEMEEGEKEISENKLYQLAIVIGIRNKDWKPLDGETQWFTTEPNIETEFFKSLMKILHPEIPEKGEADRGESHRLDRLQEYAEKGFNLMYENYSENDRVEYDEIIPETGEDFEEIAKKYTDQMP